MGAQAINQQAQKIFTTNHETIGVVATNVRNFIGRKYNSNENRILVFFDWPIKDTNERLVNQFSDKYLTNDIYRDLLKFYSISQIKRKLKTILNCVNKFDPKSISIQATYDESIFISFQVDDYRIYLDFFINNANEGFEECLLTCFKNKTQLLEFEGSLMNAYSAIFNLIKKPSPSPYVNLNAYQVPNSAPTKEGLYVY